MHQESNTREAVAAASAAHAAMTAKPADEPGQRSNGPSSEAAAERVSTRPARVITPAVERVLAWHRRRSM